MEAKASVTDVHSTPKKLRTLLAGIKKMTPVKAMDHLMYSPKKSATILYKVIKSAVDNAKATLQIDANLLKFKLLKVDQGHALRRYNPGSRGNAKPYRKQFAHISVVVGVDSAKAVTKPAKSAEKIEDVKPIEKKTLKVAKKPVQKKKAAAPEKQIDGTKS
jgi:large subunit ribosomal protein L22